jgi:ubiquinone/menaquinone biosynthesis C-methylase UbiE
MFSTRRAPRPAARRHPIIFARIYPRLSQAIEPQAGPRRRELLAGLAGSVLEVGAGNGLNFAHYPPTVTEVLAVEPEPFLRELAQAAADRAPVPVKVVEGTADILPVPDASLDAAVASLVLCSVPDQAAALAELYRVVRPGGELRVFEHLRADTPALARAQRAADLIWPLLFGGCHTGRDTLTAIIAAGFQLTSTQRFRFPDSGPPTPASPHVLATAQRPHDPTPPQDG